METRSQAREKRKSMEKESEDASGEHENRTQEATLGEGPAGSRHAPQVGVASSSDNTNVQASTGRRQTERVFALGIDFEKFWPIPSTGGISLRFVLAPIVKMPDGQAKACLTLETARLVLEDVMTLCGVPKPPKGKHRDPRNFDMIKVRDGSFTHHTFSFQDTLEIVEQLPGGDSEKKKQLELYLQEEVRPQIESGTMSRNGLTLAIVQPYAATYIKHAEEVIEAIPTIEKKAQFKLHEIKRKAESLKDKRVRCVMLGPPGVGKSTQANKLVCRGSNGKVGPFYAPPGGGHGTRFACSVVREDQLDYKLSYHSTARYLAKVEWELRHNGEGLTPEDFHCVRNAETELLELAVASLESVAPSLEDVGPTLPDNPFERMQFYTRELSRVEDGPCTRAQALMIKELLMTTPDADSPPNYIVTDLQGISEEYKDDIMDFVAESEVVICRGNMRSSFEPPLVRDLAQYRVLDEPMQVIVLPQQRPHDGTAPDVDEVHPGVVLKFREYLGSDHDLLTEVPTEDRKHIIESFEDRIVILPPDQLLQDHPTLDHKVRQKDHRHLICTIGAHSLAVNAVLRQPNLAKVVEQNTAVFRLRDLVLRSNKIFKKELEDLVRKTLPAEAKEMLQAHVEKIAGPLLLRRANDPQLLNNINNWRDVFPKKALRAEIAPKLGVALAKAAGDFLQRAVRLMRQKADLHQTSFIMEQLYEGLVEIFGDEWVKELTGSSAENQENFLLNCLDASGLAFEEVVETYKRPDVIARAANLKDHEAFVEKATATAFEATKRALDKLDKDGVLDKSLNADQQKEFRELLKTEYLDECLDKKRTGLLKVFLKHVDDNCLGKLVGLQKDMVNEHILKGDEEVLDGAGSHTKEDLQRKVKALKDRATEILKDHKNVSKSITDRPDNPAREADLVLGESPKAKPVTLIKNPARSDAGRFTSDDGLDHIRFDDLSWTSVKAEESGDPPVHTTIANARYGLAVHQKIEANKAAQAAEQDKIRANNSGRAMVLGPHIILSKLEASNPSPNFFLDEPDVLKIVIVEPGQEAFHRTRIGYPCDSVILAVLPKDGLPAYYWLEAAKVLAERLFYDPGTLNIYSVGPNNVDGVQEFSKYSIFMLNSSLARVLEGARAMLNKERRVAINSVGTGTHDPEFTETLNDDLKEDSPDLSRKERRELTRAVRAVFPGEKTDCSGWPNLEALGLLKENLKQYPTRIQESLESMFAVISISLSMMGRELYPVIMTSFPATYFNCKRGKAPQSNLALYDIEANRQFSFLQLLAEQAPPAGAGSQAAPGSAVGVADKGGAPGSDESAGPARKKRKVNEEGGAEMSFAYDELNECLTRYHLRAYDNGRRRSLQTHAFSWRCIRSVQERDAEVKKRAAVKQRRDKQRDAEAEDSDEENGAAGNGRSSGKQAADVPREEPSARSPPDSGRRFRLQPDAPLPQHDFSSEAVLMAQGQSHLSILKKVLGQYRYVVENVSGEGNSCLPRALILACGEGDREADDLRDEIVTWAVQHWPELNFPVLKYPEFGSEEDVLAWQQRSRRGEQLEESFTYAFARKRELNIAIAFVNDDGEVIVSVAHGRGNLEVPAEDYDFVIGYIDRCHYVAALRMAD